MRLPNLPVVLLTSALLAPGLAAQNAEPLELTVVRFFRPPDTTLVAALCRVPLPLLDLVAGGKNGWAAYRVAVMVRDLAGREVWQSTWRRSVAAARLSGGDAGGISREWTRFTLRPGRYVLRVTATDSATGRAVEGEQAIDAFVASAPPALSDLLLAAGFRVRGGTGPQASAPGTGEFSWEGVDFDGAGAVTPATSGASARVAYFAELYPRAGDTPLDLVVQGALGDPHGSVSATRRTSPTGRAIVLGYLPVKSLAPGAYRVRLAERGKVDGDSLSRTASFTTAGPGGEPDAAVPADVLDQSGEAALDSLYAPLVYLMRDDERGSYAGLDVSGKREYLRRFWERRDPTPGTPRNEAREDYYDRIRVANREFREGGAAEIPGWRTDRGRIFIRYGPPDDVLRQPQPPSSPPYEAWKYTRGRRLKFVFVDLTRFGNYTLVYTTDIHEPSRPGWWDLLGSRATEEVLRF